MEDTTTTTNFSTNSLAETTDNYTNIPFDSSMWSAGSLMSSHGRRTKSRDYQNKGHKEKVIASRRKKNKNAKKARKKNRVK